MRENIINCIAAMPHLASGYSLDPGRLPGLHHVGQQPGGPQRALGAGLALQG
jgi:hypothetical protein